MGLIKYTLSKLRGKDFSMIILPIYDIHGTISSFEYYTIQETDCWTLGRKQLVLVNLQKRKSSSEFLCVIKCILHAAKIRRKRAWFCCTSMICRKLLLTSKYFRTTQTNMAHIYCVQGIILKENGNAGGAERMFIQVSISLCTDILSYAWWLNSQLILVCNDVLTSSRKFACVLAKECMLEMLEFLCSAIRMHLQAKPRCLIAFIFSVP